MILRGQLNSATGESPEKASVRPSAFKMPRSMANSSRSGSRSGSRSSSSSCSNSSSLSIKSKITSASESICCSSSFSSRDMDSDCSSHHDDFFQDRVCDFQAIPESFVPFTSSDPRHPHNNAISITSLASFDSSRIVDGLLGLARREGESVDDRSFIEREAPEGGSV